MKIINYYIPICFLFIFGCATRPVQHQQKTEFKLRAAFTETQEVGDLEVVESLSQLFNDKTITQIIARVKENNFSVKAGKNNLIAANFEIDITKANLLPSLNLSANKSLTNSSSASGRTTKGTYKVSLDSVWEVDIWGKNKNQLESSQIAKQISQQNLSNLEQSLVAQAIQVYFQAINAKNTLKINQKQHNRLKQTEKTITEQVNLGLSDIGDLDNAKVSSYNALNRVQQAKLNYKNVIRSLNILLGEYPDTKLDRELKIANNYPKLNKTVLAQIPSETLLKRPDIKQSYLNVMQFDKGALIAYKEMFPKFNLTSSLGRTSSSLRDLSNGSLSVWNLVFGVVAPLFDSGRIKARVGQASSQAAAAYDNYQQTALNALREVEEALNNESSLKTQFNLIQKSLYHAKLVESQTKANYSEGTNTIFNLLNARALRYTAEQSLENIKLQRYLNRVALALALGKAY